MHYPNVRLGTFIAYVYTGQEESCNEARSWILV